MDYLLIYKEIKPVSMRPIFHPYHLDKSTTKKSVWGSVETKLCSVCKKRTHHKHNAYKKELIYEMCHTCYIEVKLNEQQTKGICLI